MFEWLRRRKRSESAGSPQEAGESGHPQPADRALAGSDSLSPETHRLVDDDASLSTETHRLVEDDLSVSPETRRLVED